MISIPKRTFWFRVSCWLMLLTMAGECSRLSAEAQAEKPRVFQAGAAAANISPPLDEPIVGNWTRPLAKVIHDELHARCLYLDDGQTKIGIVICDLLNIPKTILDEARGHLAKETDIPPDNIIMAGTHTHSATLPTSERYRSFLARRIADGIRMAQTNAVPARIGWGSVNEPSEVFVRRWYVTDPELAKNPFGGVDKVRMNPPAGNPALLRPAAIPDPEISFVSVQTREGKPICLLGNYSLHYVGGVPAGHVSADYFGAFSNRIGELIGAEKTFPPFVGILSNGTSGDVNNNDYRQRVPRKPSYERIREVSEKIAQRVAEAHQNIVFHDWVPLGSVTRHIPLQVRKPDAAMQEYFAKIKAAPEGKVVYHTHERTYADRVQALLNGPDEISIPLQVVRIGDLTISAIPFEVVSDMGLELKEKTPFPKTFTIALANDSNGYLPTPEQHELGGYETWMGTNRVQKEASVIINKNLLEMMAELKEKP